MSNFNTNDMAEALADATNHSPTNGTGPPKNEEAHQAARDHGWVEPQAYDYTEDGQVAVATHEGDDTPKWAHNAPKYEWKEDYGDIGPKDKDLEKQLFRSEYLNRRGLKFNNLCSIKVIAEAEEKPDPITDFKSAGIHPVLVENIELCGYEHPTPIQAYTIPAVLNGHDVIATAQTGSGKTAAFLIPCLSKLMGKAKKLAAPRPGPNEDNGGAYNRVRAEPLVLIVAPTRELCCQIFDEARRLCYRSMLRPCVVYGGGPVREQLDELAKGADILVATPGRLLDIMSKPHVLSLSRVRFTIIDEADEMLQDDWEEDMSKILAGGDINEDGDHRYLLFSATFNKDMRKLAKKVLATDHVRIRIGRAGSVHINVKQTIIWVDGASKQKAVYDLLISMPPSRTLIFVKSKKTADFLDDFLFNMGLPSTSIHSDRTQREREDALRAFRTGKCPILVATGVSARGLDIRNVMHVINFDLPDIEHNGCDEYIHRIGRTARIGNEGLATSFYNDKNEPMGEFLAKILKEGGHVVPEFLEHFLGEGEAVDFDDNSDGEESEVGGDAVDEGWGSGGGGGSNVAAVAVPDNAWGTGHGGGSASGNW